MIRNKGYNYIRRFLCFFNLIFWITGCCLIGLGTWLAISDYQYFRILPSYHFLSADNFILFCGLLTTFIAFLGCCGSWFESKFLLHSYLILILMVMILEILTGSFGYFYRLTVHKQLKYELLDGIREHYNETNGIGHTWNLIQSNLKCCGVDDHTDWYSIRAWHGINKVPGSCCIPNKPNSVVYDKQTGISDPLRCNRIYNNGCFNEINNWLLQHLYIVGITFIIFGFVQFFVFLSSIIIICSIKNKSNYSMNSNNYNPTYNRVPTSLE